MRHTETRVLSSMEKVFPTSSPKPLTQDLTCLKGEITSFQIAVNIDHIPHFYSGLPLSITVESDLPVTVHQVGNVPAQLLYFNNEDSHYLKYEPGLFPDTLLPDNQGCYNIPLGQWSSFFFQVDTTNASAGEHTIHVLFQPKPYYAFIPFDDFSRDVTIQVTDAMLPAQNLKYTCWFHGDCIADYYQVPVFSEQHWELMYKQAAMAHKYGQNMILVPLFTPPLDTQVGGERTTIQTIDVKVSGPLTSPESYTFGFDLFDQFVSMGKSAGMEYFELSHLFTQWGGTACPKIMADVDGEYKRIFFWDVESTSEEYKAFLTAFLPAMVKHLDDKGMRGCTYFHLTDEPRGEHLPMYLRLNNLVKPLLDGYPIIDAMSDYDFYYSGVSEIPVVATTALKPFLEGKKPEEFWVYYCCSQGRDNLSNRFIAMPGARTRVLGLQLYKEKCVGFLQWGLNFYNSALSRKLIDPFAVTDGDFGFPAGDPFIIYPGRDGNPVASQRLVIFNEALQDQRALQLLESLTGRSFVEDLMKEVAGFDITFNDYPLGEDFLLEIRNRVNQEIAKRI